MFLSGVALGAGLGLVLGVVLGHLLMQVGLQTLQATIEKVSYSLRYPKPQTNPVQLVLPTEQAFASSEEDDEQVPSWMDDEYVMER